MKFMFFCFLLLASFFVVHAQLYINDESRKIHGINPIVAANNRIHFQSFYRLIQKKNCTDTSLIWCKEYNQSGLLVKYYRPPVNIKEEEHVWRYDTTGRLIFESQKWDKILDYENHYTYRYDGDTIVIEVSKFIEKPVYTTTYYYFPSNRLIYKTGVDTAGQMQRMDYIYNENDLLQKLVSTDYGDSVIIIEYQYDSTEHLIKTIHYYWSGGIDYIENIKYENNNCVEMNQIDFFANKSRYKAVNTYDNNYNLVEQIVYTNDKFFSHTKYYYNSNNLIVRQESYDKKNRLKNTAIYSYENWP